MKTLNTLFAEICVDQITCRMVRERCQNGCGAPGVFWIRLEKELEQLQAQDKNAPKELDYAVVFYVASCFWGDSIGSDLAYHFKVCPMKEFYRISAFDEIMLWAIPDTQLKYIGDLSEEEVDELLMIRVPSVEWNDFDFLLHDCRLIAQPGLYPDDIACTFMERHMGLETWDPEDEIGSSLGKKKNLLWNRISYYKACTQLLENGSA